MSVVEFFVRAVDHKDYSFTDVGRAIGESFEHIRDFDQDETTFECRHVVFDHGANTA